MTAPLKKEIVIFEDLVDRFIKDDYFQENEITQYRFQINNIKQDNLLGISVWAFYWACSKNSEKAVSCFRNSMAYAGNAKDKALVNFVFYLKKSGQTNKYLSLIKDEEKLMLSSKIFSLWKDLAFLYLSEWRLADFERLMDSKKHENEEIKIKGEFNVISNLLDSAKKFNEITGITSEQVEKISNLMIDIAESRHLKNVNIYFRPLKEVNSIFFYTETESFDVIADANLETAKRISEDSEISSLDVSPMFMYAPKTNLTSLTF